MLFIPAMLYLGVNNRALSGLPWCPAIMTAWFCVQFVLDILPICSACISLVIWCCNTLADVTSMTGEQKNAARFASAGTTWLLLWFPGAKGTLFEMCHLGKYFRCSQCSSSSAVKRCRATFPEMKANPLYYLSRYRSHTCRERNVTCLHFCHTCSDASLFTAVCSSHRVIPWKVRMRKVERSRNNLNLQKRTEKQTW